MNMKLSENSISQYFDLLENMIFEDSDFRRVVNDSYAFVRGDLKQTNNSEKGLVD